MDPVTAAALISAVGTTISNIAISNSQRRYNEHIQDKENAYNTPAAQLDRLKQAGVNPNALTMSDGLSVQGNTSAPMNNYQIPSLSDPMSLISQSFLTYNQGKTEYELRDLRKAQAAADIETMKANCEKLGVETLYQSILNSFAAAKEQAAIQGQRFQNRLTLYQTMQVKKESRRLAKYIDEVMPEEISKLVAEKNLTVGQMDLLIEQIANVRADTHLKEKQGDVADTQAALNLEERGVKAQESFNYQSLTNEILAQYRATIENIKTQTGKTEQEAWYYLFELSQKYKITFKDMVPFYGGIYNAEGAADISSQAREKYKPKEYFISK